MASTNANDIALGWITASGAIVPSALVWHEVAKILLVFCQRPLLVVHWFVVGGGVGDTIGKTMKPSNNLFGENQSKNVIGKFMVCLVALPIAVGHEASKGLPVEVVHLVGGNSMCSRRN